VIYRLSVRAEADLAEIWVYSAEQWSLGHADGYIDALVSRFDWLCDYPSLWKPRPDITEGLYSYPQQSFHPEYAAEPRNLLSSPGRSARFDRDRASAPWADGTCPACLMMLSSGGDLVVP
jgi:plasmid stabilization system protein ParE